jgi:hypothetical protein
MEKEGTPGMKLAKQGLCRGLHQQRTSKLTKVIVVGVGVLKEMWDVSKLILLENPPGWDDSLCHAEAFVEACTNKGLAN